MSITSETIPLTDVAWQHQQVRTEIDAAIDRLLTDPTCDGAPFIRDLEDAFAAYHGDGWIAVSAQSGLAAQTLLLRAYGIGPGDEVVTAPNSDLATTAAISHVGARFVLADVAPGTFHLDPAAAEAAIGPRTRAIVPIHMYGQPAPMDELRAIADAHDLLLLEDAALALGATIGDRKAGTLGDGSFFSFAPRKVLGGTGSGGMVLVRDPGVARKVRLLRGYGLDPDIQELPIAQRHREPAHAHVAEGWNLRLDGIEAAVVAAKFRHVDRWRELRRAVADRYDAHLAGVPGIETPKIPDPIQSAWRNYTILVDDRDRLRAHLHARHITAGTLYAPPVHLQPVYAHRGLGPGAYPVAEAQGERLLCLPIYPGMEPDQVDRVVAEILAFREAP